VKVFLAWSGPNSKSVAKVLRSWLPNVIQEVDPFMSEDDIHAGTVWLNVLDENLKECRSGIICVTVDNESSKWLNFEAGAISSGIGSRKVFPFLFGIGASQLQGPLTSFQVTNATQTDVFSLLKSLNEDCDRPLSSPQLEYAFDREWPSLENQLDAITTVTPALPPTTERRSAESMFEEILALTRNQDREVAQFSRRVRELEQFTKRTEQVESDLFVGTAWQPHTRRRARDLFGKRFIAIHELGNTVAVVLESPSLPEDLQSMCFLSEGSSRPFIAEYAVEFNSEEFPGDDQSTSKEEDF